MIYFQAVLTAIRKQGSNKLFQRARMPQPEQIHAIQNSKETYVTMSMVTPNCLIDPRGQNKQYIKTPGKQRHERAEQHGTAGNHQAARCLCRSWGCRKNLRQVIQE